MGNEVEDYRNAFGESVQHGNNKRSIHHGRSINNAETSIEECSENIISYGENINTVDNHEDQENLNTSLESERLIHEQKELKRKELFIKCMFLLPLQDWNLQESIYMKFTIFEIHNSINIFLPEYFNQHKRILE